MICILLYTSNKDDSKKFKDTKTSWRIGRVAQVVKCLLRKYAALNCSPSPTKKKKENDT